jgi:hypothetical protein
VRDVTVRHRAQEHVMDRQAGERDHGEHDGPAIGT